MADDFEFELEETQDQPLNNKVEERIKNLSNKVKTTAQERDEFAKGKTEAEAKAATAEKERDYYASFADVAGNYPAATEYKESIKEKVLQGYSVEDATVSVLAKEGKLGNYMPPAPKADSPAGGSAANQLKNDGYKNVSEMNREEKRAELMRLEGEGELTNILRKNH